MIIASDFLKWLQVFNIQSGGGGGGDVTKQQVQQSAFNFNEVTGADDAFIVTLSPAVTALTDGLIVTFNSGDLQNLTISPTLKINALTPRPIVLWDGAVAPGDIDINTSYIFIYSLANNTFQLINPSVSTANTFLTQSNSYNSAVDIGAPNTYDIVISPTPVSSITNGFPLFVLVGAGNTNTGDSTITLNGTPYNIYLEDGSEVPSGYIVENQLMFLIYSTGATGFVLINPVLPSSSGGLLPWSLVSGTTQSMAINNGYISQNAAQTTFTLPVSAAVGSIIAVEGLGAAGWIIQANGSQTIQGGSSITSAGGTVTSQAGTDSAYLLCVTTDNVWKVTQTYSQGLTYA